MCSNLQAYGVRPRLQALWRAAHGLATPADAPAQSKKAKKRQRKADPHDSDDNQDDTVGVTANSDEATADALAATHMQSPPQQHLDFVTPQQSAVFAICNSYKDLLLPNHTSPTRHATTL